MKNNTRKGYGLYNKEQKGQRTVDIKSKVDEPGFAPLVAGMLLVLFLIELTILGNLWAINEIAGYFN